MTDRIPREVLTQSLTVFANPYLALDEHGWPRGAFPHEPQFHGGLPADVEVRHHGATRHLGREIRKANPSANLTAHHAYEFEFGDAPEALRVPDTDYYRRAVKSRELVAADVETWVMAGGRRETFVPPELVLLHARDGAIAQWKAHYGESAVPKGCAEHWRNHHDATVARHLTPAAAPWSSAATPAAPKSPRAPLPNDTEAK